MIVALGASSRVSADPSVETGAFVGARYFGHDTRLQDHYFEPGFSPTTAVIGLRASVLREDLLGAARSWLGLEAEGAMMPSSTSSDERPGGPSYFAAVFGYRAHLMFGLGTLGFRIHVVAGGGGESLTSASPRVTNGNVGYGYYGVGATVWPGRSLAVRADLRHGFMPARDLEGLTQTFELQLSVAWTFDVDVRTAHPATDPHPPIVVAPPVPPAPPLDSDHDGLPDLTDSCPGEAETVNGIDDDDGCAELDTDHDRIIDALDRCPGEPEDYDTFQDQDGCPDPDNDQDGLADALDKCPDAAETRNGLTDEDGCPDEIPAELSQALAAASTARFAGASAKLTASGKHDFERLAELMQRFSNVRVKVLVHPTAKGAAALGLANRRANALKWQLVDLGVMADRIEPSAGEPELKAPLLGVELIVPPHL